MEREEAIEVIRKNWPDASFTRLREALETLIPELKESEDERIRKGLLKVFKQSQNGYWAGMKIKDIVAYLEKQKEQKPAEWKPLPESMEALLLAIEGKWDAIKPTGYMSRRLEDLYDGLVNTFDVDEKYLSNLPKTEYTEKDIEEIKALKEKIDSSMETKPAEWSAEDSNIVEELYGYFHYLQLTSDKEFSPSLSIDDILKWLKSLPERFNLQPKQEWSKEEENVIETLIRELRLNAQFEIAVRKLGLDYVQTLTVLDKCRRLYPQPHWKPSKEQMEALFIYVTRGERYMTEKEEILVKDLYYELLKLM